MRNGRGLAAVGSALATGLFLAGCGPADGEHRGVELVLSTTTLESATTFDLRFQEPMVGPREIGVTPDPSPLVWQPRVSGKFTWTSSRSGTFVPHEPLQLGTTYELTLLPGLRCADGTPTRARLRHRLETPGFNVSHHSAPGFGTNAYSLPEVKLWFNADVRAAEVARFAGYGASDGSWVPARIRQGNSEEDGDYGNYGICATWIGSFPEQRRSAGRPAAAGSSSNSIGNLVVAEPSRPLSAARGWRFLLQRGYRSADDRLVSSRHFEVPIGDIQPFRLELAEMTHVVNRGPQLELLFSKALDPALTNSFTNWISISPGPGNLKAVENGQALLLAGDWKRDVLYTVEIRRGLPCEEGFRLASSSTETFSVPPVPPRLYFPAWSAEQLASGRREFPLVSVNVGRVQVRAKLMDSSAVVHALRGYRSYFEWEPGERWSKEYDGSFKHISYNLVPGRTVFEEELDPSGEPDTSIETKLSWDKLLKGRRTGVVFLQAERFRDYNSREPLLGTQAIIQITDLGMIWKMGGPELYVYVFSYASGRPIEGAKVRLFTEENEALGEVITDKAGLARFAQPGRSAFVVAESGEDLHAAHLTDDQYLGLEFFRQPDPAAL